MNTRSQKVYAFIPNQIGENWPLNIDLQKLNLVRQSLLTAGLIGKMKSGQLSGYDYGNFSIYNKKNIIVSCSQTSSLPFISQDELALIVNYDSDNFRVDYYGKKIPTSETSIHVSIYRLRHEIGSIVHAHILESNPIFKYLKDYFQKNNFPITQSKSRSREIGHELEKLVTQYHKIDMIGMLNHENGFGLLSLQASFSEACQKLIDLQNQLGK